MQEKAAAYSVLSPEQEALVQSGEIERGMDTNAVYIAWGKPSQVSAQPASGNSGTDETWVYYGDRPVIVPGWVMLPDQYGYRSLHYSPEHYSVKYIKAEVHFHNGRVVDC
jgi:hypothetical protein